MNFDVLTTFTIPTAKSNNVTTKKLRIFKVIRSMALLEIKNSRLFLQSLSIPSLYRLCCNNMQTNSTPYIETSHRRPKILPSKLFTCNSI